MFRSTSRRSTLAAFMLATPLLAASVAGPAVAQASAPDSAPSSEVSSGQRVTGHTSTHKSKYSKTSPEQPAPATRQKVQPSSRLPDEPNQVKEQVAPIPGAPVEPGTTTKVGPVTPKPHRD